MKKTLAPLVLGAAGVAAFGGILAAAGGTDRLRASADSQPAAVGVPVNLPALPKGPMTRVPSTDATQAVSVLQFDDNTCEAGLGINAIHSSLVEFDPAPPCTNAGALQILNVTGRQNTTQAESFVLHNSGATPGMVNAANVTQALSTPITAAGPCTTPQVGGLQQRVLTTPVNFTPGNATNFFAGLRMNAGFTGRDTTTSANRMWLLCSTCTMTQYSPAALAGIGFTGNWMIRVTVEDAACTPVELQNFEISD
jgi:hypothetical protein